MLQVHITKKKILHAVIYEQYLHAHMEKGLMPKSLWKRLWNVSIYGIHGNFWNIPHFLNSSRFMRKWMFCFYKSLPKSKRWIKLDYYSCQDCENLNGCNPKGPFFGYQNCLDGSADQKIKKHQGCIRIETMISKMTVQWINGAKTIVKFYSLRSLLTLLLGGGSG